MSRPTNDFVNPKDLLGIKKPALQLIPPAAIVHESLAMMNGAYVKEYGPFNWRERRVLASIYVAALKRHVDAWWDGEECAADSGVHHLGHARACLGILLDALELGNLGDDRPPAGTSVSLIEVVHAILLVKGIDDKARADMLRGAIEERITEARKKYEDVSVEIDTEPEEEVVDELINEWRRPDKQTKATCGACRGYHDIHEYDKGCTKTFNAKERKTE